MITDISFPLAIIGFVVTFFFMLDFLWSALQMVRALLAPLFLPHEETSLPKRYGAWALITGSTDGIGKAYAHELAKKGLNIILVSRNEEKLQQVARELETDYSVKTKTITADFSLEKQAVDIIRKELGDLDVGILVNNVGKTYTYPTYLGEVPEQDLRDIIAINVGAVTMLSRLFVEEMKKKRRGAIVNISSGAELQPMPLVAVYGASKAYIGSFTAALRYEYSKYGITIQHVSPMFLATKMNHFSDRLQKTNIFVADAATYARHAVNTLGKVDDTAGYWAHGIQRFFTMIAPVWIRIHIAGYLTKMFREDYFRLQKQKSL